MQSEDRRNEAQDRRVECLPIQQGSEVNQLACYGYQDVQTESLLRQISMLKADKRKLQLELENAERRHETNIDDMKAEMANTQQQLSEIRREHTRVVQQLKDNEHYQISEKNWSIQAMEEKIKSHEQRAASLECQLGEKGHELVAVTEENKEFRIRLEKIYQERSRWQEEMMAESRNQNNLAGELEESQRLLAQSEVERIQLRSQYVNVGEKFERLMEVEEKENTETMQKLIEKFEEQKERAERYRKKCEKLGSSETKIESELRSSLTSIQNKDDEIEKLNRRLKQEEEKRKLLSTEMLEAKQKTVHEQSAFLEKANSMIPLTSHKQIINEQCKQHAKTLKEIESQNLKLKSELADAEQKRKAGAKDAKELAAKCIEDTQWQRDKAMQIRDQSEEECAAMQKAMRESNEAKKTLASSLEEAHLNIMKLRKLVEEEKSKTRKAEESVINLQSDVKSTEETLEAKKKELDEQAHWAEEFESSFGKQLRSAEEEVDRLIERCHELEVKDESQQIECAEQRKQTEELRKKIDLMETDKHRLTQRLTLEQHHARRSNGYLDQLHEVIRPNIDALRKENTALKETVRHEFEYLFTLWNSNIMEKWQRLVSQHTKTEETKSTLRSKYEDAMRKNSNLSMENATTQSELKSLEMRTDQLLSEKDSLKRYSDSQEENMNLVISNMERMMLSVGEKSNLHDSLGAGNFSDMLNNARRSFNDAVTERLKREKNHARESERMAWEKKYKLLKDDMTATQEETEDAVHRLQSMLEPQVSPRVI